LGNPARRVIAATVRRAVAEHKRRCDHAGMTPDDPDHDTVHRPGRDRRVRDASRFLHDRRVEAESMIALWERSTKPRAADELRYWRDTLRLIDAQAAALMSEDQPVQQDPDPDADQ